MRDAGFLIPLPDSTPLAPACRYDRVEGLRGHEGAPAEARAPVRPRNVVLDDVLFLWRVLAPHDLHSSDGQPALDLVPGSSAISRHRLSLGLALVPEHCCGNSCLMLLIQATGRRRRKHNPLLVIKAVALRPRWSFSCLGRSIRIGCDRDGHNSNGCSTPPATMPGALIPL
jgi:hypothetical protein